MTKYIKDFWEGLEVRRENVVKYYEAAVEYSCDGLWYS